MILVYDTETTGLTLHPDAPLAKQPKIIEFGAVVLEHGEILHEYNVLINPQEELSDEIIKITGITQDMVADEPTFAEIVPHIRSMFDGCDCVMAHNLPFDKAMLMNDLRRANIRDFPWPATEICTVGLYKDIWGRNPKLIELYEDVMGVPLAQTHRALDDVHALVEIIQKEELWNLCV